MARNERLISAVFLVGLLILLVVAVTAMPAIGRTSAQEFCYSICSRQVAVALYNVKCRRSSQNFQSPIAPQIVPAQCIESMSLSRQEIIGSAVESPASAATASKITISAQSAVAVDDTAFIDYNDDYNEDDDYTYDPYLTDRTEQNDKDEASFPPAATSHPGRRNVPLRSVSRGYLETMTKFVAILCCVSPCSTDVLFQTFQCPPKVGRRS
jgi:hypothetical protein